MDFEWAFHFSVRRLRPRHLDEDEGEHRKYRRLDKPDEDLESQEGQWHEVWDEVEHHREEHFPREHIAEESEREREELGRLTHHLEEPHDRTENERLVERTHEKFRRIPAETERRDTRELYREDRDEGKRDRHIEIRRSAPNKWDDRRMPLMHSRPADRSHSREEPHPIGDKNEKKYRHSKRKEFSPRFPISQNVRREIYKCLEKRLYDILESPRNQLETLRKKRETHNEEQSDEQRRHHSIRYREPRPLEIFFCCNRNFHKVGDSGRSPSGVVHPLFHLTFVNKKPAVFYKQADSIIREISVIVKQLFDTYIFNCASSFSLSAINTFIVFFCSIKS